MTRRSGASPNLAKQRFLVIVILFLHLLYFAFNLMGILLVMGHYEDMGQSFGAVVWPQLLLGWSTLLSFVLFLATFILFVIRRKSSRIFASIAGIGGYLVNLTLALTFDWEVKAFSFQIMIFLFFMFPMVAVLSYYRMERSEEAT